MAHWKALLVGSLVLAAVPPLAVQAPAWACVESVAGVCVDPAPGVIDNTGDADVPDDPADAAYQPPAVGVANSRAQAAAATLSSDADLALYATAAASGPVPQPALTLAGVANPCIDGACPPVQAGFANQVIHPQETTYSCAPASTRNLLETWFGSDPGEAALRSQEHTSSQTGTYYANVTRTLNERAGQYDTFSNPTVTSASELMGYVTRDVAYAGHDTILNVLTDRYSFWGGHRAKHYDGAYGYDHRSAGQIYIAEEWNPSNFGISGYGNPYGRHHETLANAYAAVAANKGIIIF